MNSGDYSQGGYKVVIVACVLILMQGLLVFGRLVSRRIQGVWLGIDDYILMSATVFSITLCGLSIAWPTVSYATSWIPPATSNSETIGQVSIAWLVLYGISVALSKLAILLLYLRVFTTQRRAFTITLILIANVVIGTGIASTLTTIFQCSPVAYGWDKTIDGGKCINILSFVRFTAIPNVIDGFVMLVMPIPLVWQLELEIQQKVALTATFLHGIIGFIASITRLSILFHTDPSQDASPTTAVAWTIWTINEPANYIIAACLPTLRPIFLRILPEPFFFLTRKRDSSGGNNVVTPEQIPKGMGKISRWSWPWKGLLPKLSLGSRGASRLTGPWDRSRWEDEERAQVKEREEKKVVRVGVQEVGCAF